MIRFPLASDPSLFVATELTTPFAISPDGQTVVFTGTRGGAKPRLWVRSLDSPDARELEDTEGAMQPAVSPDGKWVAFLVENFNEIRKVRLSGGASTRLGTIDHFSASLTWASDDEILLEVLGAKAGIHRLSAGGGAPQELIPLDAAAGETDAAAAVRAAARADGPLREHDGRRPHDTRDVLARRRPTGTPRDRGRAGAGHGRRPAASTRARTAT